jgi:hypothetical protein
MAPLLILSFGGLKAVQDNWKRTFTLAEQIDFSENREGPHWPTTGQSQHLN